MSTCTDEMDIPSPACQGAIVSKSPWSEKPRIGQRLVSVALAMLGQSPKSKHKMARGKLEQL